jgi:transcriptional regulator
VAFSDGFGWWGAPPSGPLQRAPGNGYDRRVYIPTHFTAPDVTWCHALIRREPFALLVGVDEAGAPFATHLPVLLDEAPAPLGTLLGHVARPNPQWRLFASDRPVLVVFGGAHAYVSPSWYAQHPSVPTWNYVAVHAYGIPRLIEDAGRVRALLDRLVRTFEEGRPAPWRVDSLPNSYLDGMMRGIVAFEIPVERLEGKAKLSQNRSAGDQARVRSALLAENDPLARAVAELMADSDPH